MSRELRPQWFGDGTRSGVGWSGDIGGDWDLGVAVSGVEEPDELTSDSQSH